MADDSLASTAPAVVDSLVWRDPETSRFIRQSLRNTTLCGQTNLDFGVFRYAASGEVNLQGRLSAPNGFFASPSSKDTGWVYSPDSNRATYTFRYLGEPDVDLELFDRTLGKVAQLEFCGTPCRFLAVRWLDNDRFVFVKSVEYVEGRGMQPGVLGFQAYVTLYDLAADSGHTFISDLILRQPPTHIDTLTSVIWQDQEVIDFINDEIAKVSFPGYDRFHRMQFSFTDSVEMKTEECGALSMETDSVSLVEQLWVLSSSGASAAKIECTGQFDCDVRVLDRTGNHAIARVDHCESTCRYLALRWLDQEKLLVLRLDEDSRISQRTGQKVIDGYVAVLLLFDFTLRHVLTHAGTAFFN